jgi:hypothetical protein
MNKRGMLAQLIGSFVAIGIGLLLFTMVSDQWTTMINDCNNSSSYSYNDSNNPFCKMVTGEEESASTLLIKWVPYIFLATIIFISFWRAFRGEDDYGSFGDSYDEEDDDEKEDEDDEDEDEEEDEEEDIKTDELEETTKDEKKYKQVMSTKDDDELGYTGKSSSHYEKQRQKYLKKMQRFKDKKIVSEDKLNKTEFD